MRMRRVAFAMGLVVFAQFCHGGFVLEDKYDLQYLVNTTEANRVSLCAYDVRNSLPRFRADVAYLKALESRTEEEQSAMEATELMIASGGLLYYLRFHSLADPEGNMNIEFSVDDTIYLDIGDLPQRSAGDRRQQSTARSAAVMLFTFELEHIQEQDRVTVGFQGGQIYRTFEFDTEGLNQEIPLCP